MTRRGTRVTAFPHNFICRVGGLEAARSAEVASPWKTGPAGGKTRVLLCRASTGTKRPLGNHQCWAFSPSLAI